MTKRVETPSETPGYGAYCENCGQNNGFIVPLEFAYGVLSAIQKRGIDIKAEVHEQATGHQVLIVDYKPLN